MIKYEKTGHFEIELQGRNPDQQARPFSVRVAAPIQHANQRRRNDRTHANEFLREILRCVNLAPEKKGVVLPGVLVGSSAPSDEELLAALTQLSANFPELSAYLRENFENMLKTSVGLPQVRIDQREPALWTLWDYERIGYWRKILYSIARTGEFPGGVMRGRWHSWITAEHIIRIYFDTLGQALQGLNVRNLRECRICHKLFLARRIDSAVCEPNSTCAKTHSKRNERANAKLRAELAKKKIGKKQKSGSTPKSSG